MKGLKRNWLKIVAWVLFVVEFVCIGERFVYAYSRKEPAGYKQEREENIIIKGDEIASANNNDRTETIRADEIGAKKEDGIKVKYETRRHNKGEKIEIKFDKKSNGEITYKIADEGIKVSSKNDDTIEINVVSGTGFGQVDFSVEYDDGDMETQSVYTYTYDDDVYISDVAEDAAFYQCMKDRYDAGLISMQEWEEEYTNYTQTLLREGVSEEILAMNNNQVAPMSVSDTSMIYGVFAWECADGKSMSLKQTKVELFAVDTEGYKSVATTYTNNSGGYSFEVNSTEKTNYFVRCYPVSTTFEISPDYMLAYYYLQTKTVYLLEPGDTASINYTIEYKTSSNAVRAFLIQQRMIIGQRFANAMGVTTNHTMKVCYPGELVIGTDSAYCWGPTGWNSVAAIGKDLYEDTDTIIHEYGHFVENVMGNYGSTLTEIWINGPSHDLNYDNFVEKKQKEYAMELTWSEAWANVFSLIAQKSYISEYINIENIGDTIFGYTDFDADGKGDIDIEAFLNNDNSCEAQEMAVTAFLWDLFDGVKLIDIDDISLGYDKWWAYTTKRGTYTLMDFMETVEKENLSFRSKVGQSLSAHQIAPSQIEIINSDKVSASVPPIVQWRINGSTSNPNDKFQVVIFDANGSVLYTSSSYIYPNKEYNEYHTSRVPSEKWLDIWNRYDGTSKIYVAVRGYNTTEFDSGPYTSIYIPYEIEKNVSVSISSSSRYNERVIKLDKGGIYTYTVKFATSGYKLIQTLGSMDTKIEICSSTGTVLSSDDDSGYGTNALKHFYFSSGTTYQIKVKFYSTSSTGTTKLAITPANGNFTTSALSNYEGIYSITGKTSYSSVITTTANTTKVMTFTPPSSGSYTFEIQSGNDMYIYVIDPRSSALLTGTSYNDDSGINLNPLLTKTLTAGVPYLIICTPFNPSSLTSTIGFALKINKN